MKDKKENDNREASKKELSPVAKMLLADLDRPPVWETDPEWTKEAMKILTERLQQKKAQKSSTI